MSKNLGSTFIKIASAVLTAVATGSSKTYKKRKQNLDNYKTKK